MAELTTDWPLVGRGAEMARLEASLTAHTRSGVILAGPAGAGKTSLARWCADEAQRLGYSREWVVASKVMASIPLGAFMPFLPGLGAVRSADTLFRAAHEAFRGRQGQDPLLLVVDDAHLLDDLSALLVHQLVTGSAITVILTMRSGGAAPEPLIDLWKEAHIERVELTPLGSADVEELLVRVLAGPVDMAFAHALWRASAGNPLFLRELFTAAREQSLLREEDGTWRLVGELPSSPRLVELVESRLCGLDDDAREALELLAVGESLRLSHLDRLVSMHVLARLENDSLLRIVAGEREQSVELAHPVYGEVLRGSMSPLRARHLRLALARSLEAAGPLDDDDLERVARWRLTGGAALSADQLLTVARRALNRFDVDFARQCANDAYDQQPTARAGLLLGEALVLAKAHDEAEKALAEVESLAAGDDEIMSCARVRAENLFHWLDRPDEARLVIDDAARRVESDAARRLLAIQRAWFGLFDGGPAVALREVDHSLTHPDREVQLAASALAARASLAMGQFRRGLEQAERFATGQRRDAQALSGDPPFHAGAELFALIHSGRLDRAIRLAAAAHGEAIDSGGAAARGWFADMLGAAYLLRGQVASAERWFREAFTAMTRFGAVPRARVAKAGLAHSQALRGDAKAARQSLAELERVPGRRWQLLESEAVRARAWAEAAEGELASARETLCLAAQAQEAGGGYVFEAALLHDAVRLGNPTANLVVRLEALCGQVEGDLMTARARHARALLDGDAAGLADVATAFERIGANLFAAEAAAAGATAAQRQGLGREATALGRRASELAGQCEGAKTPALQVPESAAPPTLTGRELEIATLAAQGLPSKAIAERLFLSARTVDNYLGRVFTKLGVTSRAQLAESLSEFQPSD